MPDARGHLWAPCRRLEALSSLPIRPAAGRRRNAKFMHVSSRVRQRGVKQHRQIDRLSAISTISRRCKWTRQADAKSARGSPRPAQATRFPQPGLRQVVAALHTHPVVGVAPAHAFQGQCHGDRDTSPAIQQPRQRDAADAKLGGAPRHRPAFGFHALADDFARVGRIAHGHCQPPSNGSQRDHARRHIIQAGTRMARDVLCRSPRWRVSCALLGALAWARVGEAS